LNRQTRSPVGGGLVASLVTPPDELARRHFVLQDDRPAHLGNIGLAEMEPLLRGLLFTDGTVTRTLEVHGMSRVSVEVVDQAETTVSGRIAGHLKVPSDTDAVRRRVLIGTRDSATPVIWAESHIVPNRLPPRFLRVLRGAPDGIGESLQRVELESWRDLLWFGLDSHPKWSGVDTPTPSHVITRVYRVITGGQPALLISESFSVIYRDGTYHLNHLGLDSY
jgi:chorismate-pyruvate lyase